MTIRFNKVGINNARDLREYLNYLFRPYNRNIFYGILTCFTSNVYKKADYV